MPLSQVMRRHCDPVVRALNTDTEGLWFKTSREGDYSQSLTVHPAGNESPNFFTVWKLNAMRKMRGASPELHRAADTS